MSVDPHLVRPVPFEIHLEPTRYTSLHLYLVQHGNRVSSASSLVPKPVRDLLSPLRSFSSIEQDIADFFSQNSQYSLFVHTRAGVVEVKWDADTILGSKTELAVEHNRVRVKRLLLDKRDRAEWDHPFCRLGESLIANLERKSLHRLTDASGWYTANLIQEASQTTSAEKKEESLEYEPDSSSELPDAEADFDAYQSVLKRAQKDVMLLEGYPLSSETFEVSRTFFNDRKISFPGDQRESYLKDLALKRSSSATTALTSGLNFRLTLVSKKASASLGLKVSCLWDKQWFDLGDAFFKYFEHINNFRSSGLRKRRVRDQIALLALDVLEVSDPSIALERIQKGLGQMKGLGSDASWEAEEYLKRFHKTFVSHPQEILLADADGWHVVLMDYAKYGILMAQVFKYFEFDLLRWLATQSSEVPLEDVYRVMRVLHEQLAKLKVEICFQQKPIQRSTINLRVRAAQKNPIDWFEIHPEISWQGIPVSDEEWRRILENHGVWETNDGLILLEEDSLKALEALRELLFTKSAKPVRSPEQALKVSRFHILDWIHLRKFGSQVELSPENETMIRKLLQFEKVEPKSSPIRFRGVLRDYQKDGYDWLAFLYEYHLGGCLADDMGLGKTVQAIAFLGGLKEGLMSRSEDAKRIKGPHLIVSPATLVFNWKNEIENFYPDFKTLDYSGPDRKPNFEGADIVLTTYDILREEPQLFENKCFHVVILDEAQYLKNIAAKRTSAARSLKADFTLTLTGTPLENHIGEYYSILDLSLPGLLGDYREFKQMSSQKMPERLKKRVLPFVLRRKKEDTLKELPPKTESEVYLKMTAKQKALYQKVSGQVAKTIEKAFTEKSQPQATLTALTALLRLRQVCVCPELVDKKLHEISPKMDYLLDKLVEVVEEEHSALVFSQFTSFLDVLEAELVRRKIDYFRMDGKTPKLKRRSMIDSFQCGAGAPIFLISLKTGGVGLNLTRASYVFHLDPWWNPAVENQASDRVHRIGQKKNVFVTRLLMSHTVEEKMMHLKKEKAALYREVLEGKGAVRGKSGLLTKEDFKFLVD